MGIHDNLDAPLHKLNLHSHMHLIIETKKEGEQWEEYDSNWLFLRVVKYVEDAKYDFRNLESLPWQLIKVNKKTQTVADMD